MAPLTAVSSRSLPFALYIGFLVLEGLLHSWAPDLDIRWFYPVKAGVVGAALLLLWRHYTELKPCRLALSQFALSVAAGLVVFVLWINLDAGWMLVGEPGAGYDPSRPGGSLDPVLIAFRLTGAALVVPVMEELFWRSFIQRWVRQPDFITLDPAQTGMRALLIASALFAVEHHQWFAGLIAGLAYGWLYMRTQTLWAPILAHAVTNGVLGLYVVITRSWQFW